MTAYYNEIDPFNVAWLRELIKAGHIAPGDVDERSIEDVKPEDLRGYTQCHFFAGVGVWSYALRRAGWTDDRPVWTGSCPCQPFSAAGKRGGFDDKRHLWPHFEWLIAQQNPDTIFGEQVASKDGLAWFDLVQADLEGTGYAVGAVDTCAAGFGAPHIRQRLYWVADAECNKEHKKQQRPSAHERRGSADGVGRRSALGVLADLQNSGRIERKLGDETTTQQAAFRNELVVKSNEGGWRNDAAHGRAICELADASRKRQEQLEQLGICRAEKSGAREGDRCGNGAYGRLANLHDEGPQGRIERWDSAGERPIRQSGVELQDRSTGPTNGFWRDADWLFCRDGKWRPVEPGTSPLVDVTSARVGRLRGYGNAIVAAQAQAFIEAFLERDQP